jgi:hypothetical protein
MSHTASRGKIIVYAFITPTTWECLLLRMSNRRNYSTGFDNTDIVVMYGKIFRAPIISAL